MDKLKSGESGEITMTVGYLTKYNLLKKNSEYKIVMPKDSLFLSRDSTPSNKDYRSNLITTISGTFPTRMGGPQVPTPLEV